MEISVELYTNEDGEKEVFIAHNGSSGCKYSIDSEDKDFPNHANQVGNCLHLYVEDLLEKENEIWDRD